MTNVINILKHCPKGTKLYSPIFGEITFKGIYNHTILGEAIDHNGESRTVAFTRLGRFYCDFPSAECVLFPSKDQKDWDKFQIPFKRGDIRMFADKSAVFIMNYDYSAICYLTSKGDFRIGEKLFYDCIPASVDMKEKLFKAMDKAGYTWDGETLKKKPQFKPFEKVLVRDSESEKWECTFYSYFNSKSRYSHSTTSGMYAMCIPFEGNEHLVGTTKNP